MAPELKTATVGFSPESEVMLSIPASLFRGKRAETINTRFGLLEGDWSNAFDIPPGIKCEVKDFSKAPDFLKKMVELGARVLKTKSDDLLVVHSEQSLEYSKEIQEPREQELEILGRKVAIKTEFHPLKTNVPHTTYTVRTTELGGNRHGPSHLDGRENWGPWAGTYFGGSMSGGTIETNQAKVVEMVIESVKDAAKNPHRPSVITG